MQVLQRYVGFTKYSLGLFAIAICLVAAPVLAVEPSASVSESDSIATLDPQPLEETEAAAGAIEEQAVDDALVQVDSVAQPAELAEPQVTDSALAQVTSVSQLSDVQPTDWAFQALQSLVERYGCIAGYPDGPFRGQRSLTRFEFAAGLNACLDRVNELIAAGLADVATREDLAVLQRLQEEFAAELATLRGRVDALEARTAELEANQFSTTTVLVGRVQFFVSGVIDEDDDLDTDPLEADDEDDGNNGEGIDPNSQIFFGYRARFNFDTSFYGNDRLRARLEAENLSEFASDPIGFQASGDSNGILRLDDLYYQFGVGERLEFLVGAEGVDIDDLVPNSTYPLGESSDAGAISEFADPRQYETGFAGTGAALGISYQLIDRENFGINLAGGYVADNADTPSAGNGLFNGDYSAIGQITFTTDFVDLALTYVNAYSGDADFDADLYSVEGAQVANTYGAQVNFTLFDNVQIGGGIALIDVSGIGAAADYDIWSYQGTLAISDFGSEGSLLGVLAGVLPYTRELDGQTDETGFLAEIFYRYNLTDNIALTPSVIYIADPFNDNDNSETIIGTLRTVFSF